MHGNSGVGPIGCTIIIKLYIHTRFDDVVAGTMYSDCHKYSFSYERGPLRLHHSLLEQTLMPEL